MSHIPGSQKGSVAIRFVETLLLTLEKAGRLHVAVCCFRSLVAVAIDCFWLPLLWIPGQSLCLSVNDDCSLLETDLFGSLACCKAS